MPYMPAATNASVAITDQEFALFQRLIYKLAGIHLSDAKKVLLVGRLSRRLKALDLSTFSEYYRLLTGHEQPEEMQRMVDLLTTNETYFFREPKHFEYLRDKILPGTPLQPPFRVWSAACSSGEEPYTLSMLLPESDPEGAGHIAQRVLERVAALRIPQGTGRGFSQVTVSIGIASRIPHRGDTPEVLLQEADQALYQAKEQGRAQASLSPAADAPAGDNPA